MSKAIVVIDMPEHCINCPMCNGNDECILQDEDANYLADTWEKLKKGCPLREVPKKKEPQKFNPYEMYKTEYNKGYRKGYNACIDDFLKGCEEDGAENN